MRGLLAPIVIISLAVDACRATAEEPGSIVSRIGSTRGFCLVVGDGGTLAANLAKQTELTILVQLADEREVQALRQSLDAAGLLGSRVYVQQGDYTRLHLADDLADAVVA